MGLITGFGLHSLAGGLHHSTLQDNVSRLQDRRRISEVLLSLIVTFRVCRLLRRLKPRRKARWVFWSEQDIPKKWSLTAVTHAYRNAYSK